MGKITRVTCLFLIGLSFTCSSERNISPKEKEIFLQARHQGEQALEAFERCQRFVHGWLNHADPSSHLIPRNLTRDTDIWNAKDAAADNYPFMVLTCALTDRGMFNGLMADMLESEIKRTSRVDRIPDTYSFSKKDFAEDSIDMDRLIFGGSEYAKDGLLPLTEWLGSSPWSERMIGIVDDIWKYASYVTGSGSLPSLSNEVNGEMLQILSRLFWMTGDKKYLRWAYRLADFYLIEQPLIGKDEKIRLRDHGCEIVAGLSEIYLTAYYLDSDKKAIYRQPIHDLFERILKLGRNEQGMLYNWFRPLSGEHDDQICDTWGYNFNGFYTIYILDKTETYRQAVLKALSSLNDHYQGYPWEGNSADGYADAIEGAINLYNRETVPSAAAWIDSQIKVMWKIQKADGIIEGWHGDGNFARTSIMYALWKTNGLWCDPWRNDISLGAVYTDGKLYISLHSAKSWQGKIMFDHRRHRDFLHLPIDYPRINQFPEWYTVQRETSYQLTDSDLSESQRLSGENLLQGFPVSLDGATDKHFIVSTEN